MPPKPGPRRCTVHGRKPFWRMRLHGHNYHLGTNESVAKRQAGEILAGNLPAPSTRPTNVAELLEQWLAFQDNARFTRFVKPWAMFAGPTTLADFHEDTLADYLYRLQRREVKPRSQSKLILYAYKACQLGKRRKWLGILPDRPKTPMVPYLGQARVGEHWRSNVHRRPAAHAPVRSLGRRQTLACPG